ncbi:hypothetical protein PIB30_026596 [Stylosanthes scabra]|uniref:Uncharacterized protein n=1 Tax=Stylosanthes scabra TaxID=79078 RepID=A0ABU6UA94_9FABA|nr:hypothetical protein [Stylosanthes scabra]
MELLTEMQTMHGDVGGPSSSAQGVSDEDSDEYFVGDSSESSDGSEFVLESQTRQGFLLPAPASILDLSSVNSHFHMLHLDAMEEEPWRGSVGLAMIMM